MVLGGMVLGGKVLAEVVEMVPVLDSDDGSPVVLGMVVECLQVEAGY